jgi:competence protein ComEA
MKLKEFIREYLAFTQKERTGIAVIIILLIVIFFYPFISGHLKSRKDIRIDSSWVSAMRKLEPVKKDSEDQNAKRKTYPVNNKSEYFHDHRLTNTTPDLFYFDPNTISRAKWQQLGIPDKTINIIQNYLSKGGVFKKNEDLQKVYGLKKDEYNRLAPYIKIATAGKSYPGKELIAEKYGNKKNLPSSSFYKVIDINTADTTALIALPGIGSNLATRIVNFRDKLGGFYSVDQVKETFGLTDSVFQTIRQYLRANDAVIKKININTATPDMLKTHPYIRYNIANTIIAYRNEHGPFLNPEDIRKIMAIPEEVYNKIIPYIVTQ